MGMNEYRLTRLSRPWFESLPSVLGSLRSMARVMRPVGFALVSSTTLGGSVTAQQRTVADSTRDSTVVLRPIEVSVTRRQTSLFAVPFAVAIVGRDELLRGRATLGLDEALASVPGLFIANRYNPTLDQRISIRGFGSRSAFGARGVKILLDGIPQTLPDGQGQLTNVEISSLGAVEVLRGSSSSLYGNASGGVILLRTATPEPGRTEASGRMVGGAYGMVKFSGRVAAPAGRGTIVVSGARTVTDGFRDHSKAEINNVAVRFEQELSAGMSVVVSTHWAKNPTLDNPGSLTRGEVDTLPSQANARNVGADAGKAVEQGQLGVTLTKLFRSGASIGVTAFGLKRDLNNPLSFAFIRIDREALGARATVAVSLSAGSLDPRLTFGVDLQRQRDDRVHRTTDRVTITRDQLERVTEIGPFGQIAFDLSDRATVTLGSRFDRITFSVEDRLVTATNPDDSGDREMSSLSGSAGVTVRLNDAFQPYANVSTSFETPTTTELANRPQGPGGFNPTLEPQHAVSVELGVRGAAADGVLEYTAALFNIEIQDALIPFEVPSEPSRRFFQNAGSTRHRGVELSATLRPTQGVTFVSAYTLADYHFVDFQTASGTFDGNDIPGVPRHKLYGSVRLTSPAGWWLATDHHIASAHFVDDANTAASKNDGWFTTDIRVGWEGNAGAWRLAPFGGVLNVFDASYVGSVSVNAGFGRFFEPSPPRNVYVGLELSPGW